MFRKIMAPVDLAHVGRLGKALHCVADMARVHGAEVTYVGVTAGTPGAVAHSPDEFRTRLQAFAAAQAAEHGHKADSLALTSHDPTTELDDALIAAVTETGADLVIMATHMPGIGDYFWPSNGGKLAAHSGASVFLVRGE